jgi:hypothetical protein
MKKLLAILVLGLLTSGCYSSTSIIDNSKRKNPSVQNRTFKVFNPDSNLYFNSDKYYSYGDAWADAKTKCESNSNTKNSNYCFAYSGFNGLKNLEYWEQNQLAWKDLQNEKEYQVKLKKQQLQLKKKRMVNLENLYGEECKGSFLSRGFKEGTKEYNNCLLEKSKTIATKKKELQQKLAKMPQMKRIEYQCENIFNFRKSSSKFKDCTLRVYVAESEAQKIKLEKELVVAKLEASRAKEEVTRTIELQQQAASLAQRDRNNAQGLGSFLDLISVGLQIYSLTSTPTPSAPAASPVPRALSCYRSGMFQYCS